MGKVLSIASQRFNVENRAHRVISQSKPKPAPQYEANVKDLERILRGKFCMKKNENLSMKLFLVDHPEIVEQASRKDSKLDDRLKQVFVTSSNYVRFINFSFFKFMKILFCSSSKDE
jgi:NADH dehydrogenase [ubiquinone] 1 alpha subcomplex assembly factor 4